MGAEILDDLTDAAVRDLAWSLRCPPLYRLHQGDAAGRWPEVDRDWLRALDRAPRPLHRFLDRHPTHRLGRYHELLVTYFLENRPQLTDIHKNLPIVTGRRTLGELDFLYREDGAAGLTHLEVSFKFFLRFEPGESPRCWVGPNPDDRLDLKLVRLRDHQLPLGRSRAMREAHPGLVVATSLGWIRGCLFHPYDEWPHCPQPPAGCATDHWRGWWLRRGELDRLEEGRFWPLQRRQWLTPCFSPQPPALLDRAQLAAHGVERPLMVARMAPTARGWVERERGFILPRAWPERTRGTP